jgi:Cu/Ag efflux pump CusA
VADAISRIDGVADLKNGIENTISGPATTFNVNPSVASRAGFTTEEVSTDATAVLQGVPAATPLVANDRAYTIRVRFPQQNRASLQSMSDTLLTSGTGKTATLGGLATLIELPGQSAVKTCSAMSKSPRGWNM